MGSSKLSGCITEIFALFPLCLLISRHVINKTVHKYIPQNCTSFSLVSKTIFSTLHLIICIRYTKNWKREREKKETKKIQLKTFIPQNIQMRHNFGYNFSCCSIRTPFVFQVCQKEKRKIIIEMLLEARKNATNDNLRVHGANES